MYKMVKKYACSRHFKCAIVFSFLGISNLINLLISLRKNINIIAIPIGGIILFLLLALWQWNKYLHIEKTNIAKRLKKLCPDQELEEILKDLEFELENPGYNTKELIVTDNYMIGHIGGFGKEVVVPRSKIAGIYTYHQINRGRGVTHYYQVILILPKVKTLTLQFKNMDQMIDAALEIKHLCPNADSGSYDDFQEFCKLSSEERQLRVEKILKTNQTVLLDA